MNLVSLIFLTLSLSLSMNSEVYAETLKCQFTYEYFTGWIYFYGCKVQNVDIFTSSRLTITNVEGDHQDWSTNRGVEALQLKYAENLKFFPTGLNDIFPHLKSIQVTSTKLHEIKSDDLRVFRLLEYLDLSSNKITTIEKETFKYNQNLLYIDLSYNNIKNVHQKAFHGLQKLKILFLKGNEIEIITEELLSENPNLEAFIALNNKIKAIDANSFDNLNLLTSLDLTENICSLPKAVSETEVKFVIKKLKNGECQSTSIMTREQRIIYDLREEIKTLKEENEKLKKNLKIL